MTTTKILVVEDESVVALDLQGRLMGLGYEVPAIVSSGEEAIHRAEALQPDLVLMDIKLKGKMDGVQAAEQIRTRFDIPVVYLTAYADGATLQRAKITEPYGYLLKPLKERDLHTTIEMGLYKHRMERRLRESEQWLAITLKSIGDGVIATDGEGSIQFMNPVAEALTGWKEEQAQGRELDEVFQIRDGETGERGESLVEAVLGEGRVVHLKEGTLLIARDGSETPIDDSAAPIRDEKGNISGMVLVFRDTAERVRAQEAERRHAVELQARNEELDAFAQTVAHDLKNPLNLVAGFSRVLQEDYATMLEEEIQQSLAFIVENALKMDKIIEELLLLAGVRQMEAQTEPLDMGGIVTEAQRRLAHMIEEHQTEIRAPNEWPLALGYGPWIEEVWVNYLSNGIKYGGRPPRLTLGAKRLTDGDVCFWVRDNGPGLTQEEQERLFTPFTQLKRIGGNGHGLGLSIVQRIIQKLGGQVGIVSQVGRGSLFTFTLPGVPNPLEVETGGPATDQVGVGMG